MFKSMFTIFQKRTLPQFSIVLFCSLFSLQAQSQNYISGTVKDVSGEPLPGVQVLLKGSTTGTITNIDGSYAFKLPNNLEKPTLVISSTGFNTYEIDISPAKSVKQELGNFLFCLTYGKICEDGYVYKTEIHEDFRPILLPYRGQKKVLLLAIKEHLPHPVTSQLDILEKIIEEKLARLWFCLNNGDACQKEIINNHEFLTGELDSYNNYLITARKNIKNGDSIEKGLSRLPYFKEQFNQHKIFKCDH